MLRAYFFLLLFCQIHGVSVAQSVQDLKDTLFFQQTETKEWVNQEGMKTNLIKVKAQLYAPPRIFIKKDSLYKPTRVRVSFSFERLPEAIVTEIDTSENAGEYALTILKIYQLHVNKMRSEFWRSSFKKGQTLQLKEIMERNFQDMVEMDLRFRDETENGTTTERVRYWSTLIQRELDAIEKK
jgi:hypothetical protein